MSLDAITTLIIRDVAELPDRTSPDDWPEAMLVTADELRAICERRLGGLLVVAEAAKAWRRRRPVGMARDARLEAAVDALEQPG